jgi:hypothetical protein
VARGVIFNPTLAGEALQAVRVYRFLPGTLWILIAISLRLATQAGIDVFVAERHPWDRRVFRAVLAAAQWQSPFPPYAFSPPTWPYETQTPRPNHGRAGGVSKAIEYGATLALAIEATWFLLQSLVAERERWFNLCGAVCGYPARQHADAEKQNGYPTDRNWIAWRDLPQLAGEDA